MVSIEVREDSQKVSIIGHGLSVAQRIELAPAIIITPDVPKINLDFAAEGSKKFADYAAAVQGSDIASFAIEVTEVAGGNELVTRAWNSLWTFYLLSLACRSRCFPLYAVTDGQKPAYTSTNRSIFTQALPLLPELTPTHVEWAKKHADAFDAHGGSARVRISNPLLRQCALPAGFGRADHAPLVRDRRPAFGGRGIEPAVGALCRNHLRRLRCREAGLFRTSQKGVRCTLMGGTWRAALTEAAT